MEEEEEGGGGGGGGGYYKKPLKGQRRGKGSDQISWKESELTEWWEYATKEFSYPIYAVLICGEDDSEIYSYFKNSRDELAVLSGSEVCFLYFRNEDLAIKGSEWTYEEHANAVFPLAGLMSVSPIPCILFVGNSILSDCVILPLKNLVESEARDIVRDLFRELYLKDIQSIEAIGEVSTTIRRKRMKEAVLGYAGSSVSELFKSIGKTAGGIWG